MSWFLETSMIKGVGVTRSIRDISITSCLHNIFYRPPIKLWEGNVFTGVCHSVRVFLEGRTSMEEGRVSRCDVWRGWGCASHTYALSHQPNPPPDMGPKYPTSSPPLVVTPRSGHRSTYGKQAGGTHPTGMLSCSMLF